MSALQYPICNYSGVVTDIRDREFYDPSSLPFPLSGPAPCKTICERFVYEVSVLPKRNSSLRVLILSMITNRAALDEFFRR